MKHTYHVVGLILLAITVFYAQNFKMSNVPIGSGVDPELKPYVDTFKLYGKHFIKNFHMHRIDIGFGRLSMFHDSSYNTHETVGICLDHITPTIVIDRQYWNISSALQREELVFHELGHCVLGRDHTEDEILVQDKVMRPKSIMNPYTFEAWYGEFHDEYVKELFTNVPKEELPYIVNPESTNED